MNSLQNFLTETLGNSLAIGALWSVAALLILALEISLPGTFFFISFAVGAFAGAIAAWAGASSVVQCVSCTLSTLITLFIGRRFLRSTAAKPGYKSNIDALVGQHARVTSTIEPHTTGRVRVRHEEWPALCSDQNKTLHIGTRVLVTHINGNTLFVSPTSEGH